MGQPAHHFGDMRGLLTAIAVLGFDKLTASMLDERASLRDPVGTEGLLAIGVGYVRFALTYPGHFSLIFRPQMLDYTDQGTDHSRGRGVCGARR